jgi:hypothetical protein
VDAIGTLRLISQPTVTVTSGGEAQPVRWSCRPLVSYDRDRVSKDRDEGGILERQQGREGGTAALTFFGSRAVPTTQKRIVNASATPIDKEFLGLSSGARSSRGSHCVGRDGARLSTSSRTAFGSSRRTYCFR